MNSDSPRKNSNYLNRMLSLRYYILYSIILRNFKHFIWKCFKKVSDAPSFLLQIQQLC